MTKETPCLCSVTKVDFVRICMDAAPPWEEHLTKPAHPFSLYLSPSPPYTPAYPISSNSQRAMSFRNRALNIHC